MQKSPFKIFSLFLLFCLLFSQMVYGQANTNLILEADSLFEVHQYTGALGKYKQILYQQDQYSPSMLLKMAFIREGQRDYTGAMYYLHLYYAKQPSRSVLHKMEELAQAHQFTGYEYNDFKFFTTQFRKRYLKILELMLIVGVMLMTVLAIRRLKGRTISLSLLVGFTIYLVFILFYINFLSLGRAGIIRNDQVSVMSAPSAGSAWLATVSRGHKVNILGQQDIWYKIKWNGERAYVRKNNILPLP